MLQRLINQIGQLHEKDQIVAAQRTQGYGCSFGLLWRDTGSIIVVADYGIVCKFGVAGNESQGAGSVHVARGASCAGHCEKLILDVENECAQEEGTIRNSDLFDEADLPGRAGGK